MRLALLRDLHFICIFINAIKSELLTLTFQSDIVRICARIKISPFYYKANAPVANIVCIAYLPNPKPSHHLPSISFPKMYKKLGMFQFFYKRLGEEEQKAFSQC